LSKNLANVNQLSRQVLSNKEEPNATDASVGAFFAQLAQDGGALLKFKSQQAVEHTQRITRSLQSLTMKELN